MDQCVFLTFSPWVGLDRGSETRSPFSHKSKHTQLPRKAGGLGPNLRLPLLADPSHRISKAYGVLIEDKGIDLRGLQPEAHRNRLKCFCGVEMRWEHVAWEVLV